MRRTPYAASGFLLVEVLIAGGIVVIGLVALAQLFTLAVASNLASRQRTEAIVLAAQKVEELRAMPWGTEQSAGSSDRVGPYSRRWAVAAFPPRPDVALTIEVRVGRTDAGQADQARLVTVKVKQAP